MAGNRVVLTFAGDAGPLRRVIDEVNAKTSTLNGRLGKLGTGLGKVVKPLALLGAAGGAIHTLAGVAAAAQQLLPIALVLPGALLAGAAAMATFKIATAGFADALKSGAAGDKALEKLTGNARATAVEVRRLGKEFGPVKRAVQDSFFANFAGDVKNLGAQYLPVLSAKLPAIASQFNAMGRSVAFALSRPSAQGDIEDVLDNTAKSLGNMRNVLGHVTAGFLGLAGVGSQYLPRLGRAVDGVAAKFKNWVDKGVESGRINELIDGAIAGFKDLAGVAGNVGSVLGSIWKGISGGSGASSPLSTLRDLTGSLAAFFKTAEAQGPLQALGSTMASLASDVKDVLLAALRFLGPIIEALAPVVKVLGDVVRDVLVAAFDKLGPPLQRLIDKLRPIVIPLLKFLGTVITDVVIPALAGFIDWLATHINDVEDFAQNTVIAFLSITSGVLGFVSGFLGGMQRVFQVLSYIPGSFGEKMGAAAKATGGAKAQVDGLRGTVDLMHDKAIQIRADTLQARTALGQISSQLRGIVSKSVSVLLNSPAVTKLTGQRAVGGTVNQGGSYLVGERGPEILTMAGSGYVTPNSRLGSSAGGSGVQVSFTGNTSDALATVIMGLIRTGKIQLARV